MSSDEKQKLASTDVGLGSTSATIKTSDEENPSWANDTPTNTTTDDNGEGHGTTQPSSIKLGRMKVSKTCPHKTFNFLTYIGALIALLMVVGQVMAIYFYSMSPLQGILRCYVIAMSFVVLFTEMEWTEFIRQSTILNVWISRGLFYALVGVLGMIEVETEAPGEHLDAAGRESCMLFIRVVSYMITGLGLLYYVMGIFCLQIVRNRVVANYEKRCQDLKTAKKLGPSASVPPID